MTADLKKYIGWPLEAISVEPELFTVILVRHTLSAAEVADLDKQKVRARIIFIVEKVVLSNINGGAEISEIRQSNDDQGNIRCIFKFSSHASMDITAKGLIDLQF